jgi:autotransporter-associated beta strand protein
MGGTFTSNSDHWSSGFLMYYGAGTLNIGGGAVVDLQGSGTVPGFIAAGGQKQVVNIGPSTVKAGLIKGWYATDSVLNLHGGTIIARESTDGEIDNTTFMAGFQHAYLYSEGVTFTVENGHSALIKQVIEDPTGYGVTGDAITIANGGSGYISPPLVTIAGGSAGTGATGYATINSAGVVTGIVITNPGTGYALNDATPITVTFEGGHGTGAEATIDASQLAALTGGTLTKDGPGELTLSGADTYSGDTVVNNGTLNVSLGINTPNALVYVADGGTLNAPSIVADTLSIGGAAMNSAVAVAVPEPGTMVLLTLALVALSVWTRKKIGR